MGVNYDSKLMIIIIDKIILKFCLMNLLKGFFIGIFFSDKIGKYL